MLHNVKNNGQNSIIVRSLDGREKIVPSGEAYACHLEGITFGAGRCSVSVLDIPDDLAHPTKR